MLTVGAGPRLASMITFEPHPTSARRKGKQQRRAAVARRLAAKLAVREGRLFDSEEYSCGSIIEATVLLLFTITVEKICLAVRSSLRDIVYPVCMSVDLHPRVIRHSHDPIERIVQ